MKMTARQCWKCEKPLSGGTDTFGWPGDECWNCYAELKSMEGETWYGLAPHHHDLSITGSIIGSTVFDPLPEPDAPLRPYVGASHKQERRLFEYGGIVRKAEPSEQGSPS
jgi:hypothetical protein